MGKVVFEFNEDEESEDVNVVANRKKIMTALYELSCYRSSLYKGFETDAVIVSGDKILGKVTDNIPEKAYTHPIELYLKEEDIVNKIDSILGAVSGILDSYYY